MQKRSCGSSAFSNQVVESSGSRLNYALNNIEPPSVEAVERACAEFRSAGLEAF
jgi:hypothetical protein